MLSPIRSKLFLGVTGLVSLVVGLTVEIGGLPLADPLVWVAAWCWLVAFGIGFETDRRENLLGSALLLVTVSGFTLAWIGTKTYRTTTFPEATLVLAGFGGALALQLLARSGRVRRLAASDSN